MDKLFEFSFSKDNVDYYIPYGDIEIFIDSINIYTGEISKKKVLYYTIHKNLKMYKVHDPKNRFEDFWVSDDHSMIVYNSKTDQIEKKSPQNINLFPEIYYLIKNKSVPQKISCSEIEITFDPSVTEAADFTVEDNYTFCTADGIFVQDTLAVYTPISIEALEDVKKLSNIVHSANPRDVILSFTKDVKSGVCLLTMDPIPGYKFHFWKKVKYNNIWTTEGRLFIWNSLPSDIQNKIQFEYLNKKIDINGFLSYLVSKGVDQKNLVDFSYKIQNYALDAITEASESIDISTFKITEEIKPILDKLELTKEPIKQQEILNELNKVINDKLSNTDIKALLECGAFKRNQLFQLLGSKGIVLDPDGKPVLIKSNFTDGLKPTEFFYASYGARNGIISRANKTALTGYLMRKLMYGLTSVKLNPDNEFCGTTKQLELKVDAEVSSRILNRFAIVDHKLIHITENNISDIVGKTIHLYSPIYCKSKELCTRCFGKDYELLNSVYVGNIAAQSIGERLTQEMLRAFHVGGVVKPIIIDFYKNVNENTRVPIDKLKGIFQKSSETKYIATTDIELVFSKEEGYNFSMFVKNEEDSIPVIFIFCKCNTNKESLDIIFDGNANILQPFSIEIEKKFFYLKYKQNQPVFEVIPEVNDMEVITKRILSSVEGRAKVKDEYHLLIKIYREMKDMGNINLVWLEILVSQLIRNKDNPKLPARLGEKWNPELTSIKNIPYLESWIRGLEFENFGKSLTNALLTDDDSVNFSTPLDSLLI